MGTSTNYDAPPSWSPLKSKVTRLAGGGALPPEKAADLLRDFVARNGGSAAMTRGTGTLGRGKSAQNAARNLAGFVTLAGSVGLAEALRRSGLADLVGRPISEIVLALVDRCGGPGSSIDDVDARNALSRLMDEMFAEATEATEVEEVLAETGQAAQLAEVLEKFFGYCLYEQFCRVFYERLVKKHGDERAQSFLEEILDFIQSALANHVVGIDLTGVDWFGDQGMAIADDIMEQTLHVFEL
jgi:hypothetical protein